MIESEIMNKIHFEGEKEYEKIYDYYGDAAVSDIFIGRLYAKPRSIRACLWLQYPRINSPRSNAQRLRSRGQYSCCH